MARQEKSGISTWQLLHAWLRTPVALLWIIVSTVLYSCAAFVVLPISRKALYGIGHIWCRHLCAVCGVQVRLSGLEQLQSGATYVFVSNHQSHLDIPCLMSALPFHLTFMAKKELFRIPFFGWGISAMGMIAVDRSSARKAKRSFGNAIQRLQTEDIAVVIFPEGTRSMDGNIGEFKRGSFALAVDSGLPVVPVRIQGTFDVLRKKSFLIRPGKVTITLHEPVNTAGYDRAQMADTVRARIVDSTAVHMAD